MRGTSSAEILPKIEGALVATTAKVGGQLKPERGDGLTGALLAANVEILVGEKILAANVETSGETSVERNHRCPRGVFSLFYKISYRLICGDR